VSWIVHPAGLEDLAVGVQVADVGERMSSSAWPGWKAIGGGAERDDLQRLQPPFVRFVLVRARTVDKLFGCLAWV